jgi:hypothetical protein
MADDGVPSRNIRETIMSKHDEKLEQKSPAKIEISGALDDKDLEKVSGGDVALTHEHVTGQATGFATVALGMRKSAGENTSGGGF